jgi:hypothetical protein
MKGKYDDAIDGLVLSGDDEELVDEEAAPAEGEGGSPAAILAGLRADLDRLEKLVN